MKLTVRNRRISLHPGVMPLLCDEHGKPLPMQRGCTLKTNVDGDASIIVEFVIDGDLLSIVETD